MEAIIITDEHKFYFTFYNNLLIYFKHQYYKIFIIDILLNSSNIVSIKTNKITYYLVKN